jgi:hypothetical protein
MARFADQRARKPRPPPTPYQLAFQRLAWGRMYEAARRGRIKRASG